MQNGHRGPTEAAFWLSVEGLHYDDSIGLLPVDRLLFPCAQGPSSGLIYKWKYLEITAGMVLYGRGFRSLWVKGVVDSLPPTKDP